MKDNRIKTKHGYVTGVTEEESVIFKGIPYAAPPVGPRRFAVPEEHADWDGNLACDKWAADAFRSNTDYGKRFFKGFEYSEDCLYLNIWVPSKVSGEKCPVMVWLYGANGSSHDRYIDGRAYNRKGCILVSVNYRIGIMGCFGHEKLAARDARNSTGAYGIMDILFALKWIRENITAFGGNPDNVTVFGHSAGAMFTKLLLGCEPARGLFRRVISLSGGGIWDIDYIHTKESKCRLCRELLENVGWTLDDMMTRTAEEIYGVLEEAEKDLNLPRKSMINSLFHPSMDDWLIKDYYGKILAEGEVDKNADVMCGMLGEEWHNFVCQIPGGIGDYKKEFALGAVISWARVYAERGLKPIYTYFFERRMPGMDRWARHGDELPYVFGCLDRYENIPWTAFDYKISEETVEYFSNFALNGNPNGSNLPDWEPYTKKRPLTLHFAEDYIKSEDLSSNYREEQVVRYLMATPGMLDDSFPPVSDNAKFEQSGEEI